MQPIDLERCRAVAAGIELDALEAPGPHEVVARGHLRGRPVRVRFLTDPERDPKPLVKLAAALAKDGPVAGPGLVTVLEAAPDAEPPYVVEDAAPGRTLGDVLAAGDAVNLLALAHDLAAALAMLAERGLAHLALTPASVISFQGGRAKIRGLGSARPLPPEDHAERAAQEAYAAPETLAGRAPGAPADVYAVALLLCEAAARRPLFGPDAPERVTPERRLAGWTPPRALEAALGPWLASAVTASLDLKPAQRPRPEWLLNAATRAVPSVPRWPLALAPVVAFFAALVALLVSGAIKDLAQGPRPRAAPFTCAPAPAHATSRTAPAVAPGAPSPLDSALAHLRRDEFREAEVDLRPLLEAGASAMVWTAHAAALEGLGRLFEARHAYERALALGHDFAFANLRLGHLMQKLGDAGAAVAYTRAALAASPGYGCARLQLAVLSPPARGEADAVELELAADPSGGHPANHLGWMLWTRGRLAEAEVYLRRGAEDPARVPGSQMEVARFLEAKGALDEPQEIAERVIAAVPRADAYALLARVAARRKQPALATRALEAALALDPYTATGLGEVGRTLIRVNSTPERAAVLLRRAVEIDPTYHEAWEDLALAYVTLEDNQAAHAALVKAGALAPACRRCGLLRNLDGELPVVELSPGTPATALECYVRARFMSRSGRPAEALALLAVALSQEPGNLLYTRLDAVLKRAR